MLFSRIKNEVLKKDKSESILKHSSLLGNTPVRKVNYMNTTQLFLYKLLKINQSKRTNSGFTLIEVLVAMLIAFLVITPLLGLAVNLINTDRQEQAKATTEQELQAAMDYISRDLKQAVYIYDATALTRPGSSDATTSGIQDQIPPVSPAPNCNTNVQCVPVLAFWKRRPIQDAVPFDRVGTTQGTNCKTAPATTAAQNCNDAFTYSLVVYYLIRDTPNSNTVWSRTARIGRFELYDGIYDPAPQLSNNAPYLPDDRSVLPPSVGFAPFNLNLAGTTLAGKMNRWRKGAASFTQREAVQILVDYVDHTTEAPLPPFEACPASNDPNNPGWTTSPIPATLPTGFPANSFYACINSEANTARVFIRGNALARIRDINQSNYRESLSTYFPVTKTQVTSLGRLVQQR